MNVKASPPARDHILRAILAIIFSVACFSVLNAISKTLMQHYPVVQVIWARYVFAFVFMMALFLPRSGLALFRWHNVGSQVVRGLLLFYLVCSVGLFANVGVAFSVYDQQPIWWLAGAAGALMGVVWNYAMSGLFVWRKR